MTPPLARCEIWTDVACNGGTRQAVAPLVACRSLEEVRAHLVARQLTLQVPRAWADLGEVVVRRVVRVLYSDGTFDEYRILEVVDSSGGDGLVTVTALGIEHDLSHGPRIVQRSWGLGQDYDFTARNTPTALLSAGVVAHGAPTWMTLGTVTPTDRVGVTFGQDTGLAGALKVAAAVRAAGGSSYEVSVRRNGVSGYYLDLTSYGVGSAAADLRTGKSLLGVRRTLTGSGMTTRAVAFGSDGGSMGDAWFEVTALTLNTDITVADINGSTTPVILADDQFNTTYYWIHEDGVAHQITDTVKSTQKLLMASTTGIAVGEWGRIAADSGGTEVAYLDHPANQATYGVQVGVLRGIGMSHTNWLRNGDFGASGTNWTISGSVSYNQAYYQQGWQSLKFSASTGATVDQTRVIYATAGQQVAYTVSFYMTALGSAGVYGDSAVSAIRVKNPQTGANIDLVLDAQVPNTWITYTLTFDITSTGTKSCFVEFKQGTFSPAVWYVDTAQVAISHASTQSLPTAFVLHSGGADLWLAAATHLSTNSTPVATYEVSVLDLARVDPDGAGQYEALNLGATVTITDTELGIAPAVRVVRIETNHLVAHDTRLTLATAPETLTRGLAA